MAIDPEKSKKPSDPKTNEIPPEPVGDGFPVEEDVSTPPEGSDQGHDERLEK